MTTPAPRSKKCRAGAGRRCIIPTTSSAWCSASEQSWDTGEAWEDTFPLRGKDGEYRWFLSRARPIRDEEGNVVRWFGTNTDITEQREMADEIAQQAEQLADESRRKDEFLAMLSHELRNPLAPIRTAVHLLRMQERGSENAIQRQAREIIERQVANLTKLVGDLLEVSRVVSGRIQLDRTSAGDLSEVVRARGRDRHTADRAAQARVRSWHRAMSPSGPTPMPRAGRGARSTS